MGIIRKQSISGTIYTYIGVALGFVNLILITPKVFNTEQVGLVQLLLAISLIFAQLASIGFQGVTNRLFPYFRDRDTRNNGFGLLLLLTGMLGFLLVTGIFAGVKPYLIRTNIEKSTLFVDYIDFLLPLTFFTLFFNLFDGFCRAVYNSVIGIFLKEFLVRFGNLLLLIMYFFHWIDFDSYVILYVVNLSFPAIVLFIYLLVKDEFGIRFTPGFFTPTMRKDIVLLAFFGVIGGFSGIAVINIDKYMINHYLNLSATGIYSITFYFSTLILMPNRSLSKISITLLAENWKQNDLNSIRTIYYKSSINQLLIAMLLFLGIWCNTHNIFDFLPDEYRAGKYVIFFIGLGNMVNMLSGVSMQIISTSKYYRYQTYLMLLLIVLVVISNILFIPAYGLIGAALASMISTIIFVVFRFAFVYKTFNMHPFRKEHLYAIIIFVVTFGINYLIPKMENLYVDLIIRSAVISIVFLFLSWKFKVSEDGMELLDLLKQRVRKLFNSDA